MNNLEYIESYFQGALLPEEKILFERKLADDPVFADEAAFYLSMNKVIAEKLLEEKKKQFRERYKQNPPRKAVVRPMKKAWMVAAAAAVVACIAAGGFFLRQQPAEVRLANSYIDKNLQKLGGELSNQRDSMQQGLYLYDEGKLAAAGVQFEQIIRADTANFTAKEYAGLAYLRLSNYTKALFYFRQLETYTGLHSNPAKLYQALAYMKRNGPGDEEKARKLLQQVVEQNLEGKETAVQWLSELQIPEPL